MTTTTYNPLTDEHPQGYSCSTGTPWGAAQFAYKCAPGIINYSCAGHGGFHLSKTRNALVHSAWRNEDGWYEEDCEYAIVIMTFPGAFHQHHRDSALDSAKCWFPHKYEEVTGEVVLPEESIVLRDEIFAAAHADDYVTVAASGDWADWVPKGKVGVDATLGGGRYEKDWLTQRRFLVDAARYEAREGTYVIDPTVDVLVEEIS